MAKYKIHFEDIHRPMEGRPADGWPNEATICDPVGFTYLVTLEKEKVDCKKCLKKVEEMQRYEFYHRDKKARSQEEGRC